MSTISSISALLALSDSQFRIYELGRKIDKLSKETFNKIEQCQVPYPTPTQGHAHLAIVFWQKKSVQPYLWFIKLPLDERGLLNQGARDHFIAIIVEALGSDLSVDPTEKQAELLKSNPYLFTPSQYKLAMLNSLLSVELKKAASPHYQTFLHYISNNNWQNWQDVGVQGITDFASRVNENDNASQIAKILAHLPFEVLSPLCGALENCLLPVELIEAIISLLKQAEESELDKKQMLMRSLASSTQHPFVDQYFSQLLLSQSLNADCMVTISARCWQVINGQERAMQFLEHLVQQQEGELFPAIFKDLVAIPTIRPLLFQCMRSTERSDTLAKAIGQLFNTQS